MLADGDMTTITAIHSYWREMAKKRARGWEPVNMNHGWPMRLEIQAHSQPNSSISTFSEQEKHLLWECFPPGVGKSWPCIIAVFHLYLAWYVVDVDEGGYLVGGVGDNVDGVGGVDGSCSSLLPQVINKYMTVKNSVAFNTTWAVGDVGGVDGVVGVDGVGDIWEFNIRWKLRLVWPLPPSMTVSYESNQAFAQLLASMWICRDHYFLWKLSFYKSRFQNFEFFYKYGKRPKDA